MTLREKAILICLAASYSKAASARNYGETAYRLGMDVEEDDGDWYGPDMEAVEIAAVAWCRVDPEPLGIISPLDPRRDAAAAEALRRADDD